MRVDNGAKTVESCTLRCSASVAKCYITYSFVYSVYWSEHLQRCPFQYFYSETETIHPPPASQMPSPGYQNNNDCICVTLWVKSSRSPENKCLLNTLKMSHINKEVVHCHIFTVETFSSNVYFQTFPINILFFCWQFFCWQSLQHVEEKSGGLKYRLSYV